MLLQRSYQRVSGTNWGRSPERTLCRLESHCDMILTVKAQMNIGDVFLLVGLEEKSG